MIVYVEANFVLELALQQEQCESCEHIVKMCRAKKISLIVPAYSIIEPNETTVRREKQRKRFYTEFNQVTRELTRSKPYQSEADAISKVDNLITRSIEEQQARLDATVKRLLKAATIIPLGKSVLSAALKVRADYDLSPQDAIVFASILQHAATLPDTAKCFLNRNDKDFKQPQIINALQRHNCKLLFNFEDGYNYIQSLLP